MKHTKISLTAVAILSLALTLSGCSDDTDHHGGESNQDESHEQGEHSHATAEHNDAADEHSDAAAEPHEHADSHVGGGHMTHMDDVRAWLKEELKDRYDQPIPAASEATLAQGKEIYSRTCVTCHGVGGKGDGPAAMAFEQKPADFTDAAHSAYYSDSGRIHIIEKGVADTPMVGWENILDADEIQAVYGYVRSLRVTSDHVTATDGAYVCPMHPEITSDQPSKCSKCGMNLILIEAPHGHGEHAH